MSELTCTPSGLLNDFKCLSCLSQKELLAVAVYALAWGNGYDLPGDINQIIEDSACFECLSDKQLDQAMALVPVKFFMDDATVPTVAQDISCLTCASPKQLKAALAYLLCVTSNQQTINMNLLDSGVATLAGGTATVLSTSASTTNAILLTYYSLNGNQATVSYGGVVNGVLFVITSSNNTDTNQVSWAILQP